MQPTLDNKIARAEGSESTPSLPVVRDLELERDKKESAIIFNTLTNKNHDAEWRHRWVIETLYCKYVTKNTALTDYDSSSNL